MPEVIQEDQQEDPEVAALEVAQTGLDDDLRSAIKRLIEDLETPDETERSKHMRQWKKHHQFWRGNQNIFYSETSKDWKNIRDQAEAQKYNVPDKTYNIYRAKGESAIAALSSGVPGTKFFPDDAENPDDIATAKGCKKLGDQIDKYNEAELLIIQALFILWNEPFVAAYSCYRESKEYGTIRIPKKAMQPVQKDQYSCAECGEVMPEAIGGMPEQCPTCGTMGNPEVTPVETEEEVTVGYDEKNRGMVQVNLYGPLFVKIPMYVRKQEDTPYLILEFEQHQAMGKAMYPKLKSKLEGTDDTSEYDRWARTVRDEGAESNPDLNTFRLCWVRPWAYEQLGHDDENQELITRLREMFPNGLYAIFVGGRLVEVLDEDLDEHWTISFDPTSLTLHSTSKGGALMPVQDVTNESLNLELECIRWAIPITFADPQIVNFKQFQQSTVMPGSMYPTKQSRTGQPLQHAFFQFQSATLSKELDPFMQKLDSLGDLLAGTPPSIWGGAQAGGSQTLGEYELSRNQALQRLNLVWKIINPWWSKVKHKAVEELRQNYLQSGDDVRFVDDQGNGSFVNVWVRMSEMQGRIGRVTPESSDQFPMSWIAQRSMLFELLNLKDPQLNSAVYNPNNAERVSRVLGFEGFYIPGESDRYKELIVISELLKGQPMVQPMMDPMTGEVVIDPMSGMPVPGMPQSTSPPEEYDDHAVCAEVTRQWLVSEVGQATKLENEPGYMNVLAHWKEHSMFMMGQMGPMPPTEMGPQGPETQGPPGGGEFEGEDAMMEDQGPPPDERGQV